MQKNHFRFTYVFLFLLLNIFASTVFAEKQSALNLLNAMVEAIQEKDYYGNFVYISDNKIESMVYVHCKKDNAVNERLYSLNGEAREILRNDDVLTCIWPDTESVVVDSSNVDSQLPVQLPVNLDELSGAYDFSILGEERIADIQTHIVSIKPKDSYRYGYKFWIDQASKLMLKSSVVNEDGELVEQLMFTSLHIGDVDEKLLKPVAADKDFKTHELKPQASVAKVFNNSQWRISMLPHGFNLSQYKYKMKPKTVEHFVFTDGMSSLSVFIEEKADRKSLKGYSHMGAVNAFGRYEDKYHITAVGEVPAQTVRLIGEALVLKENDK